MTHPNIEQTIAKLKADDGITHNLVSMGNGNMMVQTISDPADPDYQAGYVVGCRNARRELLSAAWEFCPSGSSPQWGAGHRDAIANHST